MGSDGEGRSKDGNAGEAEKGARVEGEGRGRARDGGPLTPLEGL